MINPLMAGLIFLLLLSGCGWNGTPTRNNDFIPLTSIEISADTTTVAAHTSTRLTATGNYSGLFTRDITAQVAWSSGAPDVAAFLTPALADLVTGQAPGTAILTATVGSVSANFSLTVSSATVSKLTIIPVDSSLNKGLSRQVTVSGDFSDGTTQDLTLDADWVSSSPSVATVSNDPGSKGLVNAIDLGSATITATFTGVSDSTLLNVTAAVLQSISVTSANHTLTSLSRTAFTAVGSYSDGSTADISALADWKSSNADIATVATGGTVKTLSPGTTTITAMLTGVSGTASLKVTGGVLTGITVSPLNPRLVKNTTAQLTASGTFSNGSTRDISGAVDWTVANTDFATVETPGGNLAWLKPVAITSGTVVTAQSGTISAETSLTVTAPQLQSIAIVPTSLEQTVGTSDQLTVIASFNDGSSQDVTRDCEWTSNAISIASVGESGIVAGRVSAAANGTAIISATYGDLTKKSTVTVKTRTFRDLTITGTTSAVAGTQVTLTATASYSDGTSEDVTVDADWSLDQPDIVNLADPINQPGQVVMVDSGMATLTVSFGNLTKTLTLTSSGL